MTFVMWMTFLSAAGVMWTLGMPWFVAYPEVILVGMAEYKWGLLTKVWDRVAYNSVMNWIREKTS